MATSGKEFFGQRVPTELAKHPEKAKDVAAIYLFKISGPDGGTWTADLKSSPPTCVAGAGAAPECTIEVSDDDFRGMLDGGMAAAMQDRKSTRLNSSHLGISYAVFCLKKKTT